MAYLRAAHSRIAPSLRPTQPGMNDVISDGRACSSCRSYDARWTSPRSVSLIASRQSPDVMDLSLVHMIDLPLWSTLMFEIDALWLNVDDDQKLTHRHLP